ncbi:radical SAM protein [Faecalicatena contorta]|uniref:radical SAM protein n=1 Tax=Faecalicatena contorta TaxID=39482 RepID=UPI001F181794|nr:radical SAM protein [Faecalicatena contorta]MCF2555471.1 radical SAM protein [Faecalicatena contorta]
MEYEGQICRAPMERSAFMLPVMVGCTYNRCKFCNLFRHLKYRVLPLSQVEEELLRVKNAGGNPRKIFLGDGNAFGLGTDHLLQVLGLIKQYFPQCENINMDATVTSILKKSDDELARLYEKGVRHLYLGIESGLDDVLAFMEKDHNLEQAYEAIERLKKSGLIYDAHIMTGVAGKGRGRENAEALAKFLNETNPAHIVNFSMFIHEEAPLYAHVEDGSFIPADELECLKEEKRLIELLKGNVAGQEILYDGFHDLIEFRVRGKIPKDQEKMITKLNKAIEKFENNLDNCIS